MPFGSDPFRDFSTKKGSDLPKEYSHQCLSAVIPFGTAHEVLAGLPVWSGVTNAFRQ